MKIITIHFQYCWVWFRLSKKVWVYNVKGILYIHTYMLAAAGGEIKGVSQIKIKSSSTSFLDIWKTMSYTIHHHIKEHQEPQVVRTGVGRTPGPPKKLPRGGGRNVFSLPLPPYSLLVIAIHVCPVTQYMSLLVPCWTLGCRCLVSY